MKRTWDEQELVEHWTLFEPEAALLANRTGTGKLAVAVLLKFLGRWLAEGRRAGSGG